MGVSQTVSQKSAGLYRQGSHLRMCDTWLLVFLDIAHYQGFFSKTKMRKSSPIINPLPNLSEQK